MSLCNSLGIQKLSPLMKTFELNDFLCDFMLEAARSSLFLVFFCAIITKHTDSGALCEIEIIEFVVNYRHAKCKLTLCMQFLAARSFETTVYAFKRRLLQDYLMHFLRTPSE